MRPSVRFLSDELVQRILGEARTILCRLGVEIHNDGILSMLSDHGAQVDAGGCRALFTDEIIDRALESAPASFALYDALGEADFVMLTLPLTSKTNKFFSERELRAMKETAYLINISRGALVHEEPLARALTEGWIAGFASDLWWEYPDRMPSSYHFSVPSRMGIHRMPKPMSPRFLYHCSRSTSSRYRLKGSDW